MSNITSNIDKDELLKTLIELSKRQAPELDSYLHWLNATVEVNNILGIKPTDEDVKYIEILKKASKNENKILYDNVKVDGEPIAGKVNDDNLLEDTSENNIIELK